MRSVAVLLVAVLFAGALVVVPLGATAQQTVLSPVLTIDSERMFRDSEFGQRLASEVESQGSTLGSENRRIEAELAAEEKELTDLRPTMAPEEFRILADKFDAKVQEFRAAQAAKTRSLNQLLDVERTEFLQAAAPILEQLMIEAGAAVILERRSVFLTSNSVDITDEAVIRLNEAQAGVPQNEAPQDKP
ncbi:OmpH family outer membrane protein [Sulfitobacter sp. SK012]|uniref:OmpH family outer membrane protein n=1 Tax=Sulfitobacter sp. SK012 TaxID=1389005 RepID=UPI0015776189|nr:OmpH family outer membrane protein [Sulfitobacter sp. SK012]